MPVSCLRAGLLSIYLSFVAMDVCAPLTGCHVVCVIGSWLYRVLVLLSVDRAFEPVERVMCLNVTIANSSRHGRDAKHDPSLVL